MWDFSTFQLQILKMPLQTFHLLMLNKMQILISPFMSFIKCMGSVDNQNIRWPFLRNLLEEIQMVWFGHVIRCDVEDMARVKKLEMIWTSDKITNWNKCLTYIHQWSILPDLHQYMQESLHCSCSTWLIFTTSAINALLRRPDNITGDPAMNE